MAKEDLEIGMKITGTFKTALEQQIGEAVKIERAHRDDIKLLNSKAEFNRCELPRLMPHTRKQAKKELLEELLEERIVKEKLRKLKKILMI